jgi:flagellar protein FlgJ
MVGMSGLFGSGGSGGTGLVNSALSGALTQAKTDNIIKSMQSLADKDGTRSAEDIKTSLKTFEGMLISQLLSFMTSTVEVDSNFGGGFAEEMTRSMMTDQYGEMLAKSGGIGIADSVVRQLLQYQAANNSSALSE